MIDQRQLLRRVRIGVYVLVALAAVYLVWRFDTIELPEGSCSPLYAYAAGDRLLVDLHGQPEIGDAVFFRAPDGLLRFGRINEPPESAPEEMWRAFAAGAWWILGEVAECPGDDSRLLGPIPAKDVSGRVVLILPW